MPAARLSRRLATTLTSATRPLLKRAIHTLNCVLDELDRNWLPVTKAWQLNERHYGALQGLNKADAAAEHGEAQVKIWRRSFDVCPPALEPNDPRDPHVLEMFRDVPAEDLPYTECLKDTIARAWPYFEENIKPQMVAGKRVLIAAHGNSLRALVMQFEKLTPEQILEVNIPTGIPCSYTFDKDWNILDKHYIGDPATIEGQDQRRRQPGQGQVVAFAHGMCRRPMPDAWGAFSWRR